MTLCTTPFTSVTLPRQTGQLLQRRVVLFQHAFSSAVLHFFMCSFSAQLSAVGKHLDSIQFYKVLLYSGQSKPFTCLFSQNKKSRNFNRVLQPWQCSCYFHILYRQVFPLLELSSWWNTTVQALPNMALLHGQVMRVPIRLHFTLHTANEGITAGPLYCWKKRPEAGHVLIVTFCT